MACGGSPAGGDAGRTQGDASAASSETEASSSGGSDDATGGDATGDETGGDDTGIGPAGVLRLELAGHSVPESPRFAVVQNFNDDESVELAVDPSGEAAVQGQTCAVWVVEARSLGGWEEDDALVDVRPGGATSATFEGSFADNRIELAGPGELSSDVGAGLGAPYDVILDCNDNGVLDDGDVLDGGDRPGLFRTHDATVPGPYEVAMAEDSGGAFLGQRIFFPAAIDMLDELPLVVVTHGWSYTHTYYDYIGEHLASYGYVVMSHEADVQDGGPPGTLAAGNNTLENTDWLLANEATVGGGQLQGHIDARRIMFTGHSTGGEAVVRAVTRLRDGAFTSEFFDLGDVRIVSSMAPVSWLPRGQVDPGAVNYHMFVAGADDDVSGAPEEWYTQPLSIFERASGERQLTYIHGAGHGDLLSCCGELFLDTAAPGLIGREETNRVARGYFLALAELYLRDNEAGREFFTRPYADYHPQGIGPNVVVTNEHRAGSAARAVLDDFESGGELDRSSSGGAVIFNVANVEEIRLVDNDGSLAWSGSQASNGMTRARHDGDDPHCVVFDWAEGAAAVYEQAVTPEMQDVTGYTFLSLRAAQGTRHPQTSALAGPLSFTVTLQDEAGATSSIPLPATSAIPAPYARAGFGVGVGWQNEFVTVRLRLADFQIDSDVDLTRVVAVRLEFGAEFGASQGRLALDDLELVR